MLGHADAHTRHRDERGQDRVPLPQEVEAHKRGVQELPLDEDRACVDPLEREVVRELNGEHAQGRGSGERGQRDEDRDHAVRGPVRGRRGEHQPARRGTAREREVRRREARDVEDDDRHERERPLVRLDQALRRPREDERLNAGEEHRPHDIARIKFFWQ